jgi:hypothetical protein
MPVLNSDIARSLDKLADLLELEGANPFRVRAYRNAARVVGELPRAITVMTAAGEELAELPGIGKDLGEKIETLAATGHVAVLDEIERRTPPGLLALLDVPGLGPKRARLLKRAARYRCSSGPGRSGQGWQDPQDTGIWRENRTADPARSRKTRRYRPPDQTASRRRHRHAVVALSQRG